MRPQISANRSAPALRLDLYDYAPPIRARSGWTPRPSGRSVRVVDAWPARPAVSAAELDVFEAHFAGFLERLFGPPG
jgi:hypothetical protein